MSPAFAVLYAVRPARPARALTLETLMMRPRGLHRCGRGERDGVVVGERDAVEVLGLGELRDEQQQVVLGEVAGRDHAEDPQGEEGAEGVELAAW
ncbi:hypothetical protein [Streptomyces californicus]|uniref:hypothetical protein n=1 Tax=Streptomyces californicus TaxID=67351 RepID=UPI003411AC51